MLTKMRYFPVFLILILFDSCVQNGENNKKRSNIDSVNTISSPSIRKLPFGPDVPVEKLSDAGSLFYDSLTAKDVWDTNTYTPTYSLPTIRRYNYIQIDTSEGKICDNGVLIDSLFELKKFRYRLPDIGICKVYYMSGFSENFRDYNAEFIKHCSFYLYQSYGYLILIDTLSDQATVLPIFYSTGRDGYNISRNFFIDKDYSIYLIDYSDIGAYEENEEIMTERSDRAKYKIQIKDNGKVEISRFK